MGLFSRNESANLYQQYDIIADESYTYPTGFGRILAESAENDMNMFKALIARDFEEAAYIQEGYGGFSAEVITEGVGDFFGKIKELILKLVAKIKGIFKSFMAKFDSVVIKSNKEYWNKYKKVIYGAGVKWDGFKAKYSKQKEKKIEAFSYDPFPKFNDIIGDVQAPTPADLDKFNKTTFEDTYIEDEKALIMFLEVTGVKNLSESAEFKKEFHELYFEDEETVDDTDVTTIRSRVESVMSQGDNFGKTIKKQLDKLDTAAKKTVKMFDKQQNDISKMIGKTNFKNSDEISYINHINYNKDDGSVNANGKYKTKAPDNSDVEADATVTYSRSNRNKDKFDQLPSKAMEYASSMYSLATIFEKAVTQVHNAFLEELKFETKQCRSFMAALVSHCMKDKNKVTSESYSLIAQEAAEYEFESDFELA